MFEPNIPLLMDLITPDDLVLDVGGWVKPFNRADYVLDIQPYETRGWLGNDGPSPECFTKETWIVQDICGPEPLPFPDGMFDYVVCSHTLEDCRDPVILCSEINRIGKRGYIEVPSRRLESTMGVASKMYCGYSHHRWLVEINHDEIAFVFKPHMMHEHWKYHLPARSLLRMNENDKISCMFWEGEFSFREKTLIHPEDQARDLDDFVKAQDIYSPLKYKLSEFRDKARQSFLGGLIARLWQWR